MWAYLGYSSNKETNCHLTLAYFHFRVVTKRFLYVLCCLHRSHPCAINNLLPESCTHEVSCAGLVTALALTTLSCSVQVTGHKAGKVKRLSGVQTLSQMPAEPLRVPLCSKQNIALLPLPLLPAGMAAAPCCLQHSVLTMPAYWVSSSVLWLPNSPPVIQTLQCSLHLVQTPLNVSWPASHFQVTAQLKHSAGKTWAVVSLWHQKAFATWVWLFQHQDYKARPMTLLELARTSQITAHGCLWPTRSGFLLNTEHGCLVKSHWQGRMLLSFSCTQLPENSSKWTLHGCYGSASSCCSCKRSFRNNY